MPKQMPNRKNLHTGQGLIEFALVMPLLLLMVMAIIDFSRIFYIYSASSNATREAIRIGMTAPNDCAAIEKAAKSQFAFIPQEAYTVKITYDNGTMVKYDSCQTGQTFSPGDRVLVDVRADFSPLTPIVSGMFPKFSVRYDAARTIAYSGNDVPGNVPPPPPSEPPAATPTATSGPTTPTATPKHGTPQPTATVGGTPSPTVPVPTVLPPTQPAPTVPPPTPSAAVSPLLECTVDNGNGTFQVYFGYKNDNLTSVSIPVGADNGFSPDPVNRGQPTFFQVGRTQYWPNAAFNTSFSGGTLVWTLKGGGQSKSATASADSSPCSQQVYIEKEWYDMEGRKLSGPPAGLPASYAITAQSSLGTATCTYPAGSSTLSCTYSNRKSGSRPALDDNGLWAPVGTTYTVTEELPAGWVSPAGTGTFTSNVGGYCVNGRDGLAKKCTHVVKNSPPQLNVAFVSGYPYRESGSGNQDVYARVIVTSGGSPVSGVNITFIRFTHSGGSSTYTATTNASGYACALLDRSQQFGEMVNVSGTKVGYQNGSVGGYTFDGIVGSGGCP